MLIAMAMKTGRPVARKKIAERNDGDDGHQQSGGSKMHLQKMQLISVMPR